MLHLLSALLLSPVATSAISEKPGPYDAMTTRRYIPIGRPAPESLPPSFAKDRKVFQVADGLQAQDIKQGSGDAIKNTTLVVARWRLCLDDGSIVDDANFRQPAVFRPGTHQVPPGIEDSVLGMRTGGSRVVSGTAERILTYVRQISYLHTLRSTP